MHDLILTDLLNAYIQSPNDPSINFMLGITYYSIGQTAAAVSFYIRTAERTLDDSLKYESLIRASLCFESQGSRSLSVRGLLQHAISIMPKRPEAYYFLSYDTMNEKHLRIQITSKDGLMRTLTRALH